MSLPTSDAAASHPTPNSGIGSAIRRALVGLLVMICVLVAVVGTMMVAMAAVVAMVGSSDSLIEERYHSLAKHAEDKIAIITIDGVILESDGYIKKQIDHVRDDAYVKAVVLRVDSPGGSVTGSDLILHHLSQLRKQRKLPLVVSMGGLAASGGYYVSMAVGDQKDSIFAEPTTWTGSIGVIIPHYDLSGLMGQLKVQEDSIKSHRLKAMGSFAKPMTEEERTIFQGLVDDAFTRFKDIIKAGRPKFRENDEALTKLATGQVYTTRQALADGLVDKEGFIEDAIARAIELAGLDESKVKAVEYKRPFSFMDGLLASRASAAGLDVSALLELASPRAFYLCTWLPTLMRAR